MRERAIEPLFNSPEVIVEYPLDRCPRCNGDLGAADDNYDRRCHDCGVTVLSARLTFEVRP